jgi:hypothetical protein
MAGDFQSLLQGFNHRFPLISANWMRFARTLLSPIGLRQLRIERAR